MVQDFTRRRTSGGNQNRNEKLNYEDENNLVHRPGRRSGRERDVVYTPQFIGGRHQVRPPEDPLLYLPDASVGQGGQGGRLPDLRHGIAAGLWRYWQHQHATGGTGHQPAGGANAGLLFARRMLPVKRK